MKSETSTTGFHPAIAKAASRTLHDAAQPLTVVQGLLELTLLQARSVEEYRESVEAALMEMARVGDCFDRVRQIVRLQQPANDLGAFRLSDAVAIAWQEVKTSAPNVSLIFSPVLTDDLVEASQSRTYQALVLLLTAAGAVSTSELQLSVDALGETYVAQVRTRVTNRKLDEAVTSGIEMAQVVAASAGGQMEYSEAPFFVSLALPKAVTDQKGTPNHV